MAENGFDIIGDIHGCATTLRMLLEKLGYRQRDGVYRHENRQVVFVGDFIDRGPAQREVLGVVMPMVEACTALAVMGNHEFNAIAWATSDPVSGKPLRTHTDSRRRQHAAFLQAYAGDPLGRTEALDWFKRLPLWLDLGGIRVIHACWDHRWIDRLKRDYTPGGRLVDALLVAASCPSRWEHEAIETLLKGKEVPLPEGRHFHDKDGNIRHHIRVRWWDRQARTYRAAFMGPQSAQIHIPDDDLDREYLVDYGCGEPPVFIGHYWLDGKIEPLAPNVACVDYSVGNPDGRLVAYRWYDGDTQLTSEQFVSVSRQEQA